MQMNDRLAGAGLRAGHVSGWASRSSALRAVPCDSRLVASAAGVAASPAVSAGPPLRRGAPQAFAGHPGCLPATIFRRGATQRMPRPVTIAMICAVRPRTHGVIPVPRPGRC